MNILHSVSDFFVSHPMSSTAVVSALTGFFVRHWWQGLAAKVESKLEGLVVNTGNPDIKKIALDVDRWIENNVPDGGDARYAMAADLVIVNAPQLFSVRSLLIQLLTLLGKAAKEVSTKIDKDLSGPPAA